MHSRFRIRMRSSFALSRSPEMEHEKLVSITPPQWSAINQQRSLTPPGQYVVADSEDGDTLFEGSTVAASHQDRNSPLPSIEVVAHHDVCGADLDDAAGGGGNIGNIGEDLDNYIEDLADDCVYKYKIVVAEAEEMYEGRAEKPPFCVNVKKGETRTVMSMDTDEKVDLIFRPWLENSYGYWEYTDPTDQTKYIVKHNAGHYYAWLGYDEQFQKSEIARVCTSKPSTKYPGLQTRKILKDNEKTYSERTFRQRTARQEKPYAIEKLEHHLATSKGVKASDSDLEELYEQNITKIQKRRKRDAAGKIKPARTTASVSRSTSEATTAVLADITETYLLTYFAEIEGASRPVKFGAAQSVNDILEAIEKSWSSQLGNRNIRHCVARLPWVKGRSDIILGRDDAGSFEFLRRKILRAPMWQDDGECEVDVEIFV